MLYKYSSLANMYSFSESFGKILHNFEAVIDTRIKRLEHSVNDIAKRIEKIEKYMKENIHEDAALPHQDEFDTTLMPFVNVSDRVVTAPDAAPSEPVETENSWYVVTIQQPASITSNGPEHLIGVLQNMLNSRACAVTNHSSAISVTSGRPVLTSIVYVAKRAMQSHFISKWNCDEKDSVVCKKLKNANAVMDELRKQVETTVETAEYRAKYDELYKKTNWGSIDATFVICEHII